MQKIPILIMKGAKALAANYYSFPCLESTLVLERVRSEKCSDELGDTTKAHVVHSKGQYQRMNLN